MKNTVHPPDDSPDAAPMKTPRSPESLKNLRRGNQPSVRQQESQDDTADDCTNGQDFDLLGPMRHVFERPPAQDKTQQQRECRKWQREDRKGFMAKLADLSKIQSRAIARNPGVVWNDDGPCPTCAR